MGETGISISLTEPQAGSALTDLSALAEVKGGVCRHNGHKIFCSNASLSEHILVFCRFGPGTAGIGAVIVDRDAPGLTISKPYYHMSGAPWSELFFENAEIPEENVLFAGDSSSAN
jgi:alkylation response protein AidB-like acyl-CoA dehydrogenase